ncbi:GIY-YIG nuclease family protein [Polaribacter sp. AHE13PA]|jgi:hypothetical protein|uniref:GIY-YIG nuclease family protein n=1 Tax=Polaribacter sp. AHE13PA TaxID=2745562 RepID=UPI001C4FA33C|nr:hypothetical protein [Polaribacter sp. AHE13PA]QXP66263.1 hypothetical protein H0I28_13890 [Polaribacter sp. AHE13PA]
MTTEEIIELLKERETDFLKTKTFSQFPGIYAFFYIGSDFPLLGDSVSKHQIIYIGKTESSQEKRDSKTHFTTGKTGSSTVRKSIGSILCVQENLKPIQRNDSDYAKRRFSHFKFDNASEIKITDWMKKNMALSFYEYPESKEKIDKLETEIIKQLKPILNIDHKNLENPYLSQIKQLRKNCALISIKNSDFKNQNPEKKKTNKTEITKKPLGTSASGIVYIDNISKSDVKSHNIRIKVENKHLFPAEKLGQPISYSLDFKVENTDFIAKYKIGSKDEKSRSGVLKLGDSVYQETLKIQIGTNLKISKSKDNRYIIERL